MTDQTARPAPAVVHTVIKSSIMTSLRTRIFLSILAGAALGALLSALSGPAPFWQGWLAAGLLFALAVFFLLWAWQRAGGGRTLAWLVGAAFFTRLAVGVALGLTLPVYGFDEPEQNAGYHFYDAYHRDMQAWDLAKSDRPLWASFRDEFSHDQYGGLLGVSAAVYRYLSPGAHRRFLILILGAFTTAFGLSFFWQAVQQRWSRPLATLAAWFLALYPDGIFFGSSQMREPFLVGLIAVAFWGVVAWQRNRKGAWIALAASLLVMALISSRVTLAVAAVLAIWFWLENLAPKSRAWRVGGLAVLVVGGAAALALTGSWLHSSAHWDIVQMMRKSNRFMYEIGKVGEQYIVPFAVGYGLAQPVLPAAIADSTLPVWKIIIVARAAGWYALAPLLLYAFYSVWKARPLKERLTLLLFAGVSIAWLVISAYRAGGDMTDNPRYRSIFLPWLALLAAWGLRWAIEHRDLWLARWLLVEGIFLAYFTNWYFSRYFNLWKRLPFWEMVLMITVLSGAVLASGWLWELGKWAWVRFRRSGSE